MLLIFISLVLSLGAQEIKLQNGTISVFYDFGTKCPRQVEWVVCPDDLGDVKREPSWRFLPDIPDLRATARHDDFSHSGYDRGHMCPAADRSATLEGMRETFVMSNIAPQVPRLNRGEWQATERYCRKLAAEYDSVHVLAMPIFLNRDTTYIGKHRIAVPHAYFKCAWIQKNDSIVGIWFLWNR